MKKESPSTHGKPQQASRRQFFAQSGKVAVASALAGAVVPRVHAAENNTIRLALIGCGSRGSGAVGNAMNSANGPVKLVAMADLVESRLTSAHKILGEQFGDGIDVPKDRQFIGFDAYKQAIDCLGPGDVAMLTNFAAFRAMQLEYAVRKGVNVFMEKSFGPDVPALRRLIKAGEEAEKKNLKIAAGLQWRHSANRQELIQRIRDGALGDIQLIRAYRVHPVGFMGKKPPDQDELLWQIRNFIRFFWVSGELFAEMNCHQVDEICWIKDAWPVTAHGIGGRAANNTDHGQGLDSFSIEWTFADGTKATDVVRWLGGHCHSEFATYIHGTRCAAQFNTYGLGKGETTVEVTDASGRNRYDDIDLVAEAHSTERYRVLEDDPLSATAEVSWSWWFERKDWRIRTESWTHVACTRRDFVVRAKLEAYEGDEQVFARQFEERVRRRGN